MDDQTTTTPARHPGRWAAAAALLVAGAVGGGVLAGSLSASASTGAGSTPAAQERPGAPGPRHDLGAAPVRNDEQAVSKSIQTKLRAAALEAVPGATVYRIETDAGDGAYEAHLQKADGSLVTVKFGSDLTVTKVEDGMGAGDPRPAH